MSAVLLLDSTYEPVKVISWMRAVTLVFGGKAEIIESSEEDLHSPSMTMKKPSVIRQFGRFRRRKDVQFNRINVYMRDKWICQYCAKKKATKELTFDHVIPRAQGGETSWTNIVTACRKCNHVKDNQTPKQARMTLLKQPEVPKWLPYQMAIRMKKVPQKWIPYMDVESVKYLIEVFE